MNFDADRLAMPEEEDLDIDISTEAGPNQQLDSMLLLEQTLEEETRDISTRFQSEKRPQPAGLDRALGDDRNNRRSAGHGTNDQFAQQRYASKNGGFVTGFDPLSKDEQAKKANRAQRFGGLLQEHTEAKDEAMEEAGMDVDGKDFARPDRLPETPPRTSTIRLEAVYLYGTDEMSTKDVLKYFDAYGPSHVEWIDDSSCNIVFPDQFSAKRAVYFQLVDKENITFGEDGDDDDIEPSRETSESGVAEPIISPKSKNRLQRAKEYVPVQQHNQITTAKSNSGLFVRYATDLDRKERHSAAKSVYYAIHGREDGPSTGQRSSTTTSSRYGRRSRADEDEVWNRGREADVSLVRAQALDLAQVPTPDPGRLVAQPAVIMGAAHLMHGIASVLTITSTNRGRRGDISLRLGGRVKFPEEESAVADDRLNQYADEFLAELESTFSRREKAIPRTKIKAMGF
ncbi:hypothetical protein BGZ97_004555 [Linnemannia gamsii]|uniref:Nuclear cap-binding protein subunit 3 n=1 Tax=Linnemannia gamsii TaxID=64522 RepID=A0A9P6RFP7_9FUNG|nr:hypothetical protein BGZ97_004555 [Linnemannia gamsii]